jgi:hypothetical protein
MKPLPIVFLAAVMILPCSCSGPDGTGDTENIWSGSNLEFMNDGFQTGEPVGFISGFVVGEEAAAVLGPLDESYRIDSVSFFFGGESAATTMLCINIYRDTGSADPGDLLYSGEFNGTPSNLVFNHFDIQSNNVVVVGGGSIRIAVEFMATSPPTVARDTDGTIDADRNWIQTGGTWIRSQDLSVTGDWIIRATVSTR